MARYGGYKRKRRFGRKPYGKRRRFGGRRYGRKSKRTFGRGRRYRRGTKASGGMLKRFYRKNYFKSSRTTYTPERLYCKLIGNYDADFSQDTASNSCFCLNVFPQDPSRLFLIAIGSSYTAPHPHNLVYAYNYDTQLLPGLSSGYTAFKYTKCQIKFRIENYSASGTTATNNLGDPFADLAMVMMPKAYNELAFVAPSFKDWVTRLDQTYKYVKRPNLWPLQDAAGDVTNNTAWTHPSKTIKKTFRPWNIEKTGRLNYMADNDYETLLSTSAGTASTIGREHYVQLAVFPWTELNNTNIDCQFRMHITVKVWGHFYKTKTLNN